MQHSFAAKIRREQAETANDTAADTGNGTYDTPLDMSSLEGRIAAYEAAMEGGKQVIGAWTARALAQQPAQEQERIPEFVIALALEQERQHGRSRGMSL